MEDSFGGVTTSVYNAVNLLTSRKFDNGQTPLRIDYTYTALNEQTTVSRYSDLAGTTMVAQTGYTYDNLGRIVHLQHKDGSGTNLDNFTYTYNAASQVLTETRNTNTITTYSYDNTQQLTNDSQTTYSYDVNGNRTMTGYTTGAGNRLTNDGTFTYTYDDEGNLTKKSKGANAETWTYGYDNLNHMIWAEKRATDGGTLQMRADYKYDVFGNRIEKAVDADGAGPGSTQTTRFALDGWKNPKDDHGNPYPLVGNENWDVFADLNGSNQLQVRYVRGDQIDQLHARISSGGAVVWYVTDRLGSTRDIANSSGTVVDHLDYDGFGNTATTPSGGDRYLFTSREYDSETGLQYNRARYYDAKTGRWLSTDPIQFKGGDTNLYRYVKNMPTMLSDPSGLVPLARITRIEYQHDIARLNWVGLNVWARLPNANLNRWVGGPFRRTHIRIRMTVEIVNPDPWFWNLHYHLISKDNNGGVQDTADPAGLNAVPARAAGAPPVRLPPQDFVTNWFLLKGNTQHTLDAHVIAQVVNVPGMGVPAALVGRFIRLAGAVKSGWTA